MKRLGTLLVLLFGLPLLYGAGCPGGAPAPANPSSLQGEGPTGPGEPAADGPGGNSGSGEPAAKESGSTWVGNPGGALSLEPRNPVAEAKVVRVKDAEEASSQIYNDWHVRWDPPEAPVFSYEVERKIGRQGAWERIATTEPDLRSIEEQAAYGATLYFRIKAIAADGQFAYSREATDHTPAQCEFSDGWAMVAYSLGCFQWHAVQIQDAQNVSFEGRHKDGRDVILHRQRGEDGKPVFRFEFPAEVSKTDGASTLDRDGRMSLVRAYPHLWPWRDVVTSVRVAGDQVFVTTSEGVILEKVAEGTWVDLWTEAALIVNRTNPRDSVRAPERVGAEKFRPLVLRRLVDLVAVSEKDLYLLVGDETPSALWGKDEFWLLYHIDGVTGGLLLLTRWSNPGTPERIWVDSSRLFVKTSRGIYQISTPSSADRITITKVPADEEPVVPPAIPPQNLPGTDYEITSLARINETNIWAIAGKKYLFRYCR